MYYSFLINTSSTRFTGTVTTRVPTFCQSDKLSSSTSIVVLGSPFATGCASCSECVNKGLANFLKCLNVPDSCWLAGLIKADFDLIRCSPPRDPLGDLGDTGELTNALLLMTGCCEMGLFGLKSKFGESNATTGDSGVLVEFVSSIGMPRNDDECFWIEMVGGWS